ncbi:FHA domain-containing protein [Friedmanniella luteola]|uniref:FHA domain-containing protein n=1 Tax=Friedmanniella luteola TaxID=546871 RepID=A0A1H1YD40_9ACTN|nr:FHA domain-containing protein [Friedmanniella luteola]SDT19285.1 FHA domain-containing protein [Friedmanniella luteola]
MVALLALVALVLAAADVSGPVRAVVVAAALLSAPGLALLPWVGAVDGWVRAATAVSLSLAVETLVALAMIWTRTWHPVVAGCTVLALSAGVILVRELRSAAGAPPASRVRPAGAVETTAPDAAPLVERPWAVVLDDGRVVEVTDSLLIGRDPDGRAGRVLGIGDDTRTVSRSHLRFELDAAHLYVVDLGSANGTSVTGPDGAPRRCSPDLRTPVDVDDIVSFGRHWVRVTRGQR